jgi:hypothetical protein
MTRIHHQPGSAQFHQAMAYFRSLIGDTLDSRGPSLECGQYMLTIDEKSDVPVRVWHPRDAATMGLLAEGFILARDIATAVRRIVRDRERPGSLSADLDELPHHSGGQRPTFFFELLEPRHAFSPKERSRLFFGVIEGELGFVDSRRLRLVRLQQGLYGMAVRGSGSYLIEMDGTKAYQDVARA